MLSSTEIKSNITLARQQIREWEAEIGKLTSEIARTPADRYFTANRRAKISGLKVSIQQRKAAIGQMQRSLANVELAEGIEAHLRAVEEAKAAKIARERKQQAQEMTRKEALAAWLLTGESEASFEAAWPELRKEIARSAALEAAVNAPQPLAPDPIKAAAQSYINQVYGGAQ